jgi:hypothetical protein
VRTICSLIHDTKQQWCTYSYVKQCATRPQDLPPDSYIQGVQDTKQQWCTYSYVKQCATRPQDLLPDSYIQGVHCIASLSRAAATWPISHMSPVSAENLKKSPFSPAVQLISFHRRFSKRHKFPVDDEFPWDKVTVLRDTIKCTPICIQFKNKSFTTFLFTNSHMFRPCTIIIRPSIQYFKISIYIHNIVSLCGIPQVYSVYLSSIPQIYNFIFYCSIHILNWRWSNMFRTLYEVHLQGHLF